MSKKMMVLAAGVLAALAFAALPAVASAGEPEIECGGAGVACGNFSLHGGTAELNKTSGPSVHCTSASGGGSFSSTKGGTINITFHGCTETAFGSTCTSAGQTTGTISTGTLPFTNVYVSHGKTTPGVTVGPVNVTFTCFGGFVHNRVTGSVLGHLESECTQNPGATLAIDFATTQPGHQKFMKVTGTEAAEDLISSLNNGAYETAGQKATGKVTLGSAPTVTCV